MMFTKSFPLSLLLSLATIVGVIVYAVLDLADPLLVMAGGR
jgi:hypothetical protein